MVTPFTAGSFKPSIHGWPFGNCWKYTIPFIGYQVSGWGFCGGMCRVALDRFYNARLIPRDTPQPQEGDSLYSEIFNAQTESLPLDTIWKIYTWQMKPDLSHRTRQHSLGYSTLQEWPKLKSYLDNSKPITLTIIKHSNDGDVFHLSDNHRVVAYAYQVRDLVAGSGEGAPDGASQAVDIAIYDPNYPNDDDVLLTFYLGGDNCNIRLHYNKPNEEAHGFFLDDKERSFSNPQSTAVKIDSCVQTGISSIDRADYDLKFSWKCSFVPYFIIQVDGGNWKYNRYIGAPGQSPNDGSAWSELEPKNMDNKQCTVGVGHMTVKLRLPRAVSKVTLRFLDSDYWNRSVDVDATPTIKCYPYLHQRAPHIYTPCICEVNFSDNDLFIKEDNPTDAEIQQLDTSFFRWIYSDNSTTPESIPQPPSGLNDFDTTIIDQYKLGNVIVPVFGDFVEENLRPGIQTSGFVTITKTVGSNRQTQTLPTISPLSSKAQRIFDGFTDNPADYDNDTTVEFNYQAIEDTGLVVKRKTIFYGKSIILMRNRVFTPTVNPSKLAKMEMVAATLIEMGLIDTAITLPTGGPWPPVGGSWPTPDFCTMPPCPPVPSGPTNRPLLLSRLQSNRQIVEQITRTLKAIWNTASIWDAIRSDIVKMIDSAQKEKSWIDVVEKADNRLAALKASKVAEQNEYDNIVLNTLVYHTFIRLTNTRDLVDQIRRL